MNKKLIRTVTVCVLGLVMVVPFQNCSQTKFTSGENALSDEIQLDSNQTRDVATTTPRTTTQIPPVIQPPTPPSTNSDVASLPQPQTIRLPRSEESCSSAADYPYPGPLSNEGVTKMFLNAPALQSPTYNNDRLQVAEAYSITYAAFGIVSNFPGISSLALNDVEGLLPIDMILLPNTRNRVSQTVVVSGLPTGGECLYLDENRQFHGINATDSTVRVNDAKTYMWHEFRGLYVKNGDKLTFTSGGAGFRSTIQLKYRIGDSILGSWKLTTGDDPGTRLNDLRFLDIETASAVGDTVFSSVETVSGLGNGVKVKGYLGGWFGGQPAQDFSYADISINGEWLRADTQPVFKNGDRVQLKHKITEAERKMVKDGVVYGKSTLGKIQLEFRAVGGNSSAEIMEWRFQVKP